jgi:putative tricarboxylic transport membrane protein
MRIRAKKDLYAGLMFIAFGLVFALGALNYPMGSALRMGPAYFPSVLGWMLVVLGLIIASWGLMHDGEEPRKTGWRGLIYILGSVVVFGWVVNGFTLHWAGIPVTVPQGGLVLACIAMVILSAYGGWEFKWKEGIINSIVLAVTTVGIFYYGLGLPFRLWPWS